MPMLLYLFYLLYMLLPFRLQKTVSLIELVPPETAKTFGTIFPYLGVLELCALMIAGVQWIRRGFKLYKSDYTFFVYIGISISSIAYVCLRQVWGGHVENWECEIVFIVRLCALYFLFISLSLSRISLEKMLFRALTFLFVAYLILYTCGIRNENMFGNIYDRMNAPGLEVTSTGYLAGVLMCGGISLARGKWRFLMGSVGMVSLLIAGSRAACTISGVVILIDIVLRCKKNRLIFALVFYMLVICVVGVLVSQGMYRGIPLFNRFNNEDNEKIVQTDPIADMSVLMQYEHAWRTNITFWSPPQSLLERLLAWHVGTSILLELRGEPVGSDWAVQSRLVEAGFPSHTHSVLLQSFIKYGFLAFVIWIVIVRGLWSGMKTGSPYIGPLLVLVMGGLVDYWFFVDKAAFVFFALMKLNDKWILESRNLLDTRNTGKY